MDTNAAAPSLLSSVSWPICQAQLHPSWGLIWLSDLARVLGVKGPQSSQCSHQRRQGVGVFRTPTALVPPPWWAHYRENPFCLSSSCLSSHAGPPHGHHWHSLCRSCSSSQASHIKGIVTTASPVLAPVPRRDNALATSSLVLASVAKRSDTLAASYPVPVPPVPAPPVHSTPSRVQVPG